MPETIDYLGLATRNINLARGGDSIERENFDQKELNPGQEIILENRGHKIKVLSSKPKMSLSEKIGRKLRRVYLPKSSYYKINKMSSYLLVSPDILQVLEEQIPDYKIAQIEYSKNVAEALSAKTVSHNDIDKAYKKRDVVGIAKLEKIKNKETDRVNDAVLKSPKIPALLDNSSYFPEIIVLRDISGIGVKITLEDIKSLKGEEKGSISVVFNKLSESNPLKFEGEDFSSEVGQVRALKKKDSLEIETNHGGKLIFRGVSANKCKLEFHKN